jgi:hypothetical protein
LRNLGPAPPGRCRSFAVTLSERTTTELVPGHPEKTREIRVGHAGELIAAERDGYYYEVSYSSLKDYIEPRPGLDVVVHVGKK